ncbi:ATP-binding protein [Methylobacterium brachiatum]|nr:ATP-binding protein [Methylobacterium brachiatum]
MERETPGLDRAGNSLGPAPWDVVNEALKTAGFPYEVISPKDVSITRDYKFKLKDRFDGNTIEVTDLSSGEKVIIQLVLWLYGSNKDGIFPKLLLLDEPDAHLHPSMILQFMDVIDEVLVKKHGIRVIMSSHSPSTVALAPDGSVFQLERGNYEITEVSSRSDIISILTAGLVTVSKSSKFVFVEDEDDVNFYEAVRDILSNYGPSRDPMAMKPTPSIVFMPASIGSGAKKVSGGATVVRQWTAKFGQEPLKAMFLGVIDRDVNNVASNKIFVIGRYSFENYILDPLNIYSLLVENNTAPSIPGISIASGDEHLLRMQSKDDLQKITDAIVNLIEAGEDSLQSTTKIKVDYTFGQSIDVPDWVINRRGHDLLPIAQRTFGGANLINPPRLLRALRRARLIPVELAGLFAQLQAY